MPLHRELQNYNDQVAQEDVSSEFSQLFRGHWGWEHKGAGNQALCTYMIALIDKPTTPNTGQRTDNRWGGSQ